MMDKQAVDAWYGAAMRGLAQAYDRIRDTEDVAPYARRLLPPAEWAQVGSMAWKSPRLYKDVIRGEVVTPILAAAGHLITVRTLLYMTLSLEPDARAGAATELERYRGDGNA